MSLPWPGWLLVVAAVLCAPRPGGSSRASLNETLGPEDAPEDGEPQQLDCDEARMRCVYRDGCNRALSAYFDSCASQLRDDIHYCPKPCHYALVGLMSTDEGKDMMNCKCMENDVFCARSRRQAEVCRSSVETVLSSERVSCRAATYICSADTLCGTAYSFYFGLCRRMFLGKKCTKRCMNSISILRRQEKAAKLNECYCDGPEDHECLDIQRNMRELCFDRPAKSKHKSRPSSTSTTPDSAAGADVAVDAATSTEDPAGTQRRPLPGPSRAPPPPRRSALLLLATSCLFSLLYGLVLVQGGLVLARA